MVALLVACAGGESSTRRNLAAFLDAIPRLVWMLEARSPWPCRAALDAMTTPHSAASTWTWRRASGEGSSVSSIGTTILVGIPTQHGHGSKKRDGTGFFFFGTATSAVGACVTGFRPLVCADSSSRT